MFLIVVSCTLTVLTILGFAQFLLCKVVDIMLVKDSRSGNPYLFHTLPTTVSPRMT